MKLLASLIAFSALISYSWAFVCSATYCNSHYISCEGYPTKAADCVIQNDDKRLPGEVKHTYKFMEHASRCGCCHMCVAILGLGEQCPGIHPLDAEETVRCDQGLYCDQHKRKCVKLGA